jgi:hypothetical protein
MGLARRVPFCRHLRSKGYTVNRLQVLPQGEAKPIFSDLYVPEIPLLVEAKGTVERGSIRMALGQLMDYRRFVNGARCAILPVATQNGYHRAG